MWPFNSSKSDFDGLVKPDEPWPAPPEVTNDMTTDYAHEPDWDSCRQFEREIWMEQRKFKRAKEEAKADVIKRIDERLERIEKALGIEG